MERRRFLRTALVLPPLAVMSSTSCAPMGAERGGAGPGSTEGFPVTITSCDSTLTFDGAPQRLVLLEAPPAPLLDALGVLDTVVARAGAFPDEYFDDDLAARIRDIPSLSEEIDGSGHLLINQETVLAHSPDLVLGLPDGVTREGLATVGAQALVNDSFCGSVQSPIDFTAVYDQVELHGRIFGRSSEAAELVDALRGRVDAVADSASAGLTAAAVFPSVGNGPLYAYGTASMAHAQMEILGLTNVFASSSDRVFEISDETLLSAAPDLLLVLHQDAHDHDGALEELRGRRSLASLSCLQEANTMSVLFNFCDPPSPLVVDGLERIAAWLQDRAL